MTQSHYKFPNLLNICRQGHYVWYLYLTFSLQVPLEHPTVILLGQVMIAYPYINHRAVRTCYTTTCIIQR